MIASKVLKYERIYVLQRYNRRKPYYRLTLSCGHKAAVPFTIQRPPYLVCPSCYPESIENDRLDTKRRKTKIIGFCNECEEDSDFEYFIANSWQCKCEKCFTKWLHGGI